MWPISQIPLLSVIYYILPPVVWGIWDELLFIFRNLGELAIIFKDLGSKFIVFGIKGALQKSFFFLKKSHLKGKAFISFDFF